VKRSGTVVSVGDGIAGFLARRFVSSNPYLGLSQALLVLVLFLISPVLVIAQNVAQPAANQMAAERSQADSVFLHIKQVLSGTTEGPTSIKEKCGFRIQSEIRRYWNLFSAEEQASIKSLLARPTLQASVLSPSGHFRVHYDTTGRNTPALLDDADLRLPNSARAYVDSVAAIFDYVWEFETKILGYPSPPPDQGSGGGNEYDVYVVELGGSSYGFPDWSDEDVLDSQRPNPTYMTWIVIDNDYIEYYTHGLEALKVTAAHEFHHAIQVGNYGWWENDTYYYELTSTWMEDVVYAGINDYLQYLPLYFGNTATPFNVSNGYIEYGRAVWGKFIEKRFGRVRMRRSWEYLSSMRSLQAIDASLREAGTDFVREFPEFSLWHFYTGHRADPITYFSEATLFPEIRPIDLIEFVPPAATISSTARNLSIQVFQLTVSGGGMWSDTVSMVLTNINLVAAENSDDQSYNVLYRFTTGPADETYGTLVDGLKVKLEVSDPGNWKSIGIVNTGITITAVNSPYPNPFLPGKSGGVAFPIDASQRTTVTVNIYSSSFDLVCSKVEDSTIQFGKQVVIWDGKNSNGSPVASGIYVYRIVSGDKEYKGKIAVVR
jgi:hypothetical protein